MSNFLGGLLIDRSDRPNMSISTKNLSVTGQWLQYNEKINTINQPTLQICCTYQIFFQSTTSGPFYGTSRRDSSVCGIPTSGFCMIPNPAIAAFIIRCIRSTYQLVQIQCCLVYFFPCGQSTCLQCYSVVLYKRGSVLAGK